MQDSKILGILQPSKIPITLLTIVGILPFLSSKENYEYSSLLPPYHLSEWLLFVIHASCMFYLTSRAGHGCQCIRLKTLFLVSMEVMANNIQKQFMHCIALRWLNPYARYSWYSIDKPSNPHSLAMLAQTDCRSSTSTAFIAWIQLDRILSSHGYLPW